MDDSKFHKSMDFSSVEQSTSPTHTSSVINYSPMIMSPDEALLCSKCKSNPIQIPSSTYPLAGILTPPDTPTSPFGSMMKPLFPPKLCEIQDSSVFPACIELDKDCASEGEANTNITNAGNMDSPFQPQASNTTMGSLKPKPNLRLKVGLEIKEPFQSQGNEGLSDFEDDLLIIEEDIEDVELPRADSEESQGETKRWILIGSDLRKMADKFHETYARVDGVLEEAALNISTALTSCLSVTFLCLSIGEVHVDEL